MNLTGVQGVLSADYEGVRASVPVCHWASETLHVALGGLEASGPITAGPG